MYLSCSPSTFLQKAIQDNHESKRRKKRPAVSLLKKQEDDPKDTMAELAAEAAAAAAARTEHIREETQKILERKSSESDEKAKREERVLGEVISSPKDEIHDIRSREVHRMDLKERLPWLKEEAAKRRAKSIAEEAGTGDGGTPMGEGGGGGERDVVSPDSGVMEQLGEAGFDSDIANLSPEHTHTTPQHLLHTSKSPEDIPVHLQNGELEHGTQTDITPDLPPRDYLIQFPPRDYPKSESRKHGAARNDLLDDDDYYTLMLNAAVN